MNLLESGEQRYKHDQFSGVSRFGLAVRPLAGKQRDLRSNPLRLSLIFKSCGLWTLSCDFVPHNCWTLKWLSSLPTLMQKSFWWWLCSDRYRISPPPPPPTFSLSLISLMVSVDVTHHVYLLTVSEVKTAGTRKRPGSPPRQAIPVDEYTFEGW